MVALMKRLLSAKQVAAAIGGSEPTVWRKDADGTLPKSIKLSAGMTRWDADEIEAWIESKKAARFDTVAASAPGIILPLPAVARRNPVPPSTRPDAKRPGRPRKLQEAGVPA